jgi:hypothetical protein
MQPIKQDRQPSGNLDYLTQLFNTAYAWTPTWANDTFLVCCWTASLHKLHFRASVDWKRTAKPLYTKQQHRKQLKRQTDHELLEAKEHLWTIFILKCEKRVLIIKNLHNFVPMYVVHVHIAVILGRCLGEGGLGTTSLTKPMTSLLCVNVAKRLSSQALFRSTISASEARSGSALKCSSLLCFHILQGIVFFI